MGDYTELIILTILCKKIITAKRCGEGYNGIKSAIQFCLMILLINFLLGVIARIN